MRFLRTLREPQKIDLKFVMERQKEIENLCQKHSLGLFYVYGSLAKDNMKKLSDVDIAVMADRKLSLDTILDLIGETQKIFKREDIDIVDLNEVPPLLKMRILQQGKLLFKRSESDLAKFRFKTIGNYLGTLYLRKNFSRYLEYAILGGKA